MNSWAELGLDNGCITRKMATIPAQEAEAPDTRIERSADGIGGSLYPDVCPFTEHCRTEHAPLSEWAYELSGCSVAGTCNECPLTRMVR